MTWCNGVYHLPFFLSRDHLVSYFCWCYASWSSANGFIILITWQGRTARLVMPHITYYFLPLILFLFCDSFLHLTWYSWWWVWCLFMFSQVYSVSQDESSVSHSTSCKFCRCCRWVWKLGNLDNAWGFPRVVDENRFLWIREMKRQTGMSKTRFIPGHPLIHMNINLIQHLNSVRGTYEGWVEEGLNLSLLISCDADNDDDDDAEFAETKISSPRLFSLTLGQFISFAWIIFS